MECSVSNDGGEKLDVTYDDVGRASSVSEKDSVSKVIRGYKKFS